MLLSDAHQGEDSSQTEEDGWNPCGEERRENPWFPKGKEDIKGDAIGKSDQDTDPDAQGDPSGSACLQSKRDTYQDHDQI